MKKASILFAISLMICLLCSCGGRTVATITDNDGNTVQMTADELIAVSDENSARFEDLYKGAGIELTGTVESVSNDSITLKDGWEVTLSKSKHHDLLTSLNKGDEVYVKSNIYHVWATRVELTGMTNKIGYNDDTKKVTVCRTVAAQEEYVNEFNAAYEALSVSEQEFFDSFADFFKRYAHEKGMLEFYYIRAWSSGDGYTYFYLEQPSRKWIRIEDGESTYISASDADTLKIPKDTQPVLDDYEAVQEVINMYIDM